VPTCVRFIIDITVAICDCDTDAPADAIVVVGVDVVAAEICEDEIVVVEDVVVEVTWLCVVLLT
jgi:hypothetical protein